ncbi:MAG TPA: AI-2E family transporter [Candidatus Saccharimonadales bacterium]
MSEHEPKKASLTEITISTDTFIRLAALIIGTLLLIWVVRKTSHALILIFVAFFLALALNSPVYAIARRLPGKLRGNRALGTGISFLIVVIVIGAFITYITPPLAKQTDNFISAAPHLIKEFKNQNGAAGNLIRRYHLGNEVTSISNQLSKRLHNVGGTAFSTAISVGSSIFSVVTILVLTFMMLVEGPRWLAFSKEIIPSRKHQLVDRLSHDMYKVIKGFVNGQVILAAIAATLIMPAVLLLHIGYPIALILIIFICGLIPMVGHTIGAIIVTIVALFHSTSAGVIILAYYLLYQQFENYIIQPRIQANTTNMSPLLVLASVIVGISFGGLLGGLIAIPAAGCARILILEYLRTNNIIDSIDFEKATTKSRKTSAN